MLVARPLLSVNASLNVFVNFISVVFDFDISDTEVCDSLFAFALWLIGNCTTWLLRHSEYCRTRTCTCVADHWLRTQCMLCHCTVLPTSVI